MKACPKLEPVENPQPAVLVSVPKLIPTVLTPSLSVATEPCKMSSLVNGKSLLDIMKQSPVATELISHFEVTGQMSPEKFALLNDIVKVIEVYESVMTKVRQSSDRDMVGLRLEIANAQHRLIQVQSEKVAEIAAVEERCQAQIKENGEKLAAQEREMSLAKEKEKKEHGSIAEAKKLVAETEAKLKLMAEKMNSRQKADQLEKDRLKAENVTLLETVKLLQAKVEQGKDDARNIEIQRNRAIDAERQLSQAKTEILGLTEQMKTLSERDATVSDFIANFTKSGQLTPVMKVPPLATPAVETPASTPSSAPLSVASTVGTSGGRPATTGAGILAKQSLLLADLPIQPGLPKPAQSRPTTLAVAPLNRQPKPAIASASSLPTESCKAQKKVTFVEREPVGSTRRCFSTSTLEKENSSNEESTSVATCLSPSASLASTSTVKIPNYRRRRIDSDEATDEDRIRHLKIPRRTSEPDAAGPSNAEATTSSSSFQSRLQQTREILGIEISQEAWLDREFWHREDAAGYFYWTLFFLSASQINDLCRDWPLQSSKDRGAAFRSIMRAFEDKLSEFGLLVGSVYSYRTIRRNMEKYIKEIIYLEYQRRHPRLEQKHHEMRMATYGSEYQLVTRRNANCPLLEDGYPPTKDIGRPNWYTILIDSVTDYYAKDNGF